MATGREVRSYEYVNRPYAEVRAALTSGALEVFRAATKRAAARAHSMAAELSVNIGGIEVATDIAITVSAMKEKAATVKRAKATEIHLEWEAARSPRLFPFMKATLSIYALTATETQLDFAGSYEPPLGFLGGAVDALVGRHVAEATVHRFVREVAEFLRKRP